MNQPFLTLSNGIQIPQFGLGTYLTKDPQDVFDAVQSALDVGYRHIDTARIYGNESAIGEVLSSHPISREEIFITTKVWNSDQGYDKTLRAFDASIDRLDLTYIDLYLIHWPVKGKFKETWKALELLLEIGKVRAIGVCNFLPHQLSELLGSAKIKPMVNQFEFHPWLQQPALVELCRQENILVEGWAPLMQGRFREVGLFEKIAKKHHKTAAQILLRWHIQKGVLTIPKSANKTRIKENVDIFDFALSQSEVACIDGLECGKRVGPDPDNFDF